MCQRDVNGSRQDVEREIKCYMIIIFQWRGVEPRWRFWLIAARRAAMDAPCDPKELRRRSERHGRAVGGQRRVAERAQSLQLEKALGSAGLSWALLGECAVGLSRGRE